MTYHVGIVGSGPIGLYAGCVLAKIGYHVTIWERGEVAENVLSWKFVELFSKTELNLPSLVRSILEEAGHILPENDSYITGGKFRSDILLPLAKWIESQPNCLVKTKTQVKSIGRGRLLKAEGLAALNQGAIRRNSKFRILLFDTIKKEEFIETCDVLIDASGTYSKETALRSGMGGICCPGEDQAESSGLIHRIILDPADTSLFQGKRIAVLGSGYSAITALRQFSKVPEQAKPAYLLWLVRSSEEKDPYTIIPDDPLPQRSALSKFGNELAKIPPTESFECLRGVVISKIIKSQANSISLQLQKNNSQIEEERTVDLLVSLVGYKPSNLHLSELQVCIFLHDKTKFAR
mmetsp:Transcript_16179/g.19675  ORF Transcript_16179/g.19675 Transcript_16179/m.19675 type:complete len:350 (-) Transcript_16179:1259-2308(-)